MKRYMLFAGDFYYPLGGINDFVGSFDEYDEAFRYAEQSYEDGTSLYDWWQIVNSETFRVVERSERQGYAG